METKVIGEIEKRGHEQVTFFHYPQYGLKAIVAIHSTVLGPALGGCRMRLYEDEGKAIDDVLRLSEGMTYKNAIAGMDLGGGKSCIIADPNLKNGRRELFLKFGQCLNDLNGRYITAEDMGTSVDDVMIVREVSKHVSGVDPKVGGGGDPSPWTAKGVYQGMLAACEKRYGSRELKGKEIAIQGVGHVGMYLLKLLTDAGAKVTVCDTSQKALDEAKSKFDATVVGLDQIYDVKCHIYSPCAIGQTVNPQTIGRLRCDIIAGGANNQLTDASMYRAIEERKLMYCPDFVINGGGVINVGAEYVPGGWKEAWVAEKVSNIYHTVKKVLDESEKRGKFPEIVALELARERIAAAEKK